MDLLGTNLEDLLKECNGKLTLQSVLILADNMVSIYKYSITVFPKYTCFEFYTCTIQNTLNVIYSSDELNICIPITIYIETLNLKIFA